MINNPEDNNIKELNRKVKRLELLVLALIASDGMGDNQDNDELIYLFERFSRKRDDFREDRHFYRFFERLLDRPRQRDTNLRASVDELEKKSTESQNEFRQKLSNSDSRIHKLIGNVEELQNNLNIASKELHHYLIFQSLGEESKNIKLDRFIPVRVYLSDDKQVDIDKITNALDGVLDAFGFEFSDDFPAEKGSWWKKWFAKSKDVITQPEVAERFEKIERAIDVKGLHKPQADLDKTKAEAIATLIASVKEIPKVAIQAGSILLVKIIDSKGDACVQVRTLSTKELIYLENNQHLLCKPETVMQSLSCGSVQGQLSRPKGD